MAFRLEHAGRTNVGLVREKNEDSFLVAPELGLYVVCDGMGGHVGGQVASQTAVAAIADAIRAGVPLSSNPDVLAAAIKEANRTVYTRAKADPSLHNMGTTVVAIRQEGDVMHLCHVGDSRIYRLHRGSFEQVTRDHNLSNLYLDDPELASRLGPRDSNALVRAVGLRDEVEVDHRPFRMEHGDLYLLCCDGLTDMVDDWILKELISDAADGPIEECADALIRAALANGGVDNITAVVLRILAQ